MMNQAPYPLPGHLIRSPQGQQSQNPGQNHFVAGHQGPFLHYPSITSVASQNLPTIPAALFQQDTPFLMVIPMLFNAREGSFVYQNGVIVPPNTATNIAGYTIVHQPLPPAPNQQQQQQHGQHQQMQNGYGPGIPVHQQQQQPNFGENQNNVNNPAGSRSSPNQPPQANVPNSNVMYGYPQPHQSLSHFPMMPQQFYGPGQGFLPTQQLNYIQSGHAQPHSEHQLGSSRPMEDGKQGGSPSDSSAQSRSSSYSSSTLDVEHTLERESTRTGEDSETLRDETAFSRSITPSPETVTHLTIAIQNDPNQGAVESLDAPDNALAATGVNASETTSQKSSGSKSSASAVSAPNGDFTDTKQSGGVKSGSSSAAGQNRSVTSSPVIAQSSAFYGVEKATLAPSADEPVLESQRTTSAPNAPSPVPAVLAAPKTWASLVGQGGPKMGTPTLAANLTMRTASITPHSESAREKPHETPRNSHAPREDGRHFPTGSQQHPSRQYEFPKLPDNEADAFPDDLQVYIRDIPVAITSDHISNAMKKFGDLVDVRLRYHQGRRDSRFCFVLFTKREPADYLLEKGVVVINGCSLQVQRKKRQYTR